MGSKISIPMTSPEFVAWQELNHALVFGIK